MSSYFIQTADKRAIVFALGLIGFASLQGCADIRKESAMDKFSCSLSSNCVTVIIQPELAEAAGLRNIALVPGTGQGANSIITQLESRLSKVHVDDKPYYTFSKPGDAGVQGIFEISTPVWTVSDSNTIQDQQVCVDSKCKNMTTKRVNCKVRKGSVSVLMRLKGKGSSHLATRESSSVSESTLCVGDSGSLAEPSAVLGNASAKVLDELQNALAVRTVTRKARVMVDAADITDPDRRNRFTSAVEFSKAGRMDRACPIYEELIEVEASSVAPFYNAGFCAQARGDWRKAFQLYSKADGNSAKPNDDLKQALEETRTYGALQVEKKSKSKASK